MRNPYVRPAVRAAAVLMAASLISSCAVGAADSGRDSGKAVAYPTKGISLLAPGSPGGGWDTRARGMALALTQCKVIDQKVTVSNKPGPAARSAWPTSSNTRATRTSSW
ncbi:hypothetical protein ABZ027_17105 [Streptomyces sp. NPDC006332]|uniref:hypothetical protein n=1 Tax=Streptomyces sp. NPDC006332 TaxID=3155456 RepID=UPI0033B0ED79